MHNGEFESLLDVLKIDKTITINSINVSTTCSIAHWLADTLCSNVKLLDSTRYFSKSIVEAFRFLECRIRLNHFLRFCLMEECSVVELEIVDGLHLRLIEPLNAFSIFPQTKFDFVVLGYNIGADTVLLALVPVPFIASPVCPSINSKSMFLVVFVLALVHSSVVPDVNAHAFHVVVKPLTLIASSIQP